jgi:putative flippase GtrA
MKLDREVCMQFIKFGIVGVSNTVIYYAVYAALVSLSLQYIAANIIAFSVSVLNAFFWNNKYVFKKTAGADRNAVQTLIKTALVYGFTGLLLSNGMLYLLVEALGVSKYFAPLFCICVTVPLNFMLNKFWAFRSGG